MLILKYTNLTFLHVLTGCAVRVPHLCVPVAFDFVKREKPFQAVVKRPSDLIGLKSELFVLCVNDTALQKLIALVFYSM